MRKRIEALLLGKLERVTPGLPCGGGTVSYTHLTLPTNSLV